MNKPVYIASNILFKRLCFKMELSTNNKITCNK